MHNPLIAKGVNEPRKKVFEHYKYLNYVNISESQKKLAAVPQMHFVKTVYNGIDVAQFSFNAHPKDHFIWIARVDKYKGIGNAVKAAKLAKVKLLMAGRLDYTQEKYFANEIKPHLNSQIRFIGEIGGTQKSEFYREAKALLYPIEWDEPFGLVMVEAMACGTPVIAFNHGSVREIVKNGITGFVVNTIPEMIRAMKKIDSIDRRTCRKWVEEKFSVKAMVDGYEEVYERVLASKKRR
jgi:glycosyltransferase involved in cell wall biosynthesis